MNDKHAGKQPTVLIVGASKGLGYGLAAEFVKRNWRVIGTVRGDKRSSLHDLAEHHPDSVHIEQLDMVYPRQIAMLKLALQDEKLDALFICAGITTGEPLALIRDVDAEEFARVMVTNAYAPLQVMEALQDLVTDNGLIGAMSSGQGSIGNNLKGQREVYRASKAALNMLVKAFAAHEENRNRAIVVLAPGWIKTDLGGPDAPFTLEETVPSLVDVLLAKRDRPGVEYLDRFGDTVPW